MNAGSLNQATSSKLACSAFASKGNPPQGVLQLGSATVVLLFRLGIVIVLYLFLLEVVRVIWRDLSPPVRRQQPSHPLSANLEIVNPARTGLSAGEIIVLSGATTIGRESGNDLVVDEDTVSSRHARLILRDGGWWIEDLGSTNGVWVNEAHIEGSGRLQHGDVIRIGRLSLRFSP